MKYLVALSLVLFAYTAPGEATRLSSCHVGYSLSLNCFYRVIVLSLDSETTWHCSSLWLNIQ